MRNDKAVPYIQICSLEAAREADVFAYDGVITIEDSTIEEPFRIETDHPPQRVIVFDDLTVPMDDYVLPEERHVRSAISFAREWASPSLLVHCHAGMSRSPAIALAILAEWLGSGKEEEAVAELLKVVPLCTPNSLLVELADKFLGRNGELVKSARTLLYGPPSLH